MAAVTITVNSRGYRPVAVNKSGYMLEHLEMYPQVLARFLESVF